MTVDLEEDGLFAPIVPTASNLLRDRYGVPPFSVLERRHPDWTERDRRWKQLGIQSEVGRGDALTFNMAMSYGHNHTTPEHGDAPQTSVFSPTLCELVYRWYSAEGAHVLDPFAGGSVRGIVAGAMDRHYTGIELRAEQVAANQAQAHIAGQCPPTWLHGDSARMADLLPPSARYDLIFSCPPYAHLEKYSDDPTDLSSMDYPDFLRAYRGIIAAAVNRLRDDRFAVWVVGEVRAKDGSGHYIGLVPDTIKAFQDAGAHLYNDHVILTPIGTTALRAPKQFDASRKAGRIHEYVLVFIKGNGKRATQWATRDDTPTPLPLDPEPTPTEPDGDADELYF